MQYGSNSLEILFVIYWKKPSCQWDGPTKDGFHGNVKAVGVHIPHAGVQNEHWMRNEMGKHCRGNKTFENTVSSVHR